jgi:sialate O-acetylesterase
MNRFVYFFFAICLVSLGALLVPSARANVKLPRVLGSHMVLQRDKPLPIWGQAEPGEEVKVKLGEESANTKADEKGKWKVTLPAMKADGKTHKLTVTGKNKIELNDILIGEVWVGSGQSNMEWQLSSSQGSKETIAAAKQPQIRLLQIPKVQVPKPASDVPAQWEVCTPNTVGRFSGVLYHFGLALQKELKVPVGLINSSWGGSPIEPWTVVGEQSGTMYNGMIAPLQPFPIRGVVWYQGETNAFLKNGLKYRDKMEDLIMGWRGVWGQDMSFYFVQLAPYYPDKDKYPAGELPALWEAQAASLKIPGTGMVVTTDLVDNIKDIHPVNKKDVGNRLALWALAKDYGKKDLVFSGPLYKGMKIESTKIRLEFAHLGGGLKSRDGKPLREFQIAGADGKFVPAEAVIDGDAVVVSAKGVDSPTQVRFGWEANANPNLMNKEGLPASPFQTKDWHGGTGE